MPASPAAVPHAAPTLPQRWVTRRRRASLFCLLGVWLLALAMGLSGLGGADVLDSWWLRARFSLRERLLPYKVHPHIVIAEIDDRSLEEWRNQSIKYPDDPQWMWSDQSMRWAGHIARAVEKLQQSQARVVGLDWIQPVDFDASLRIKDSEQLGAVLSRGGVVLVKQIMPASAPAANGSSEAAGDKAPGGADVPAGQYVLPAPSLRIALPNGWEDNGSSWMGYAEAVTPDSIQTFFYPQPPPDAGALPGEVAFATRVAEKALGAIPAVAPRPDGTLLINYASGTGLPGAEGAFRRVSLCDLERMTKPDPAYKDAIVLVGATYKGNNDAHFVPFLNGLTGARLISGVEVQANAVATLLHDNSLRDAPPALTWLLAAALGSLGVGLFAAAGWGRATFWSVALLLGWAALSLLSFVGANVTLPLAVPALCLFAGITSMGTYRVLSEERERAVVMRVWGRHQDPRLISELLAHPEWRGGEGREAQVTVLFADLKNFTKTVEPLTPKEALEALNRYLALLSETILAHGGVVDKYLGDGLMAQWGAPVPRPDHANAAVRACLEIERRLRELTPDLKAAGEVTFETRLTLHTGPVVAGPLGSDQRLEYTIIGDTVNVTSRLQETAKAMDCDFLISETTREACTLPVRYGREEQVEIRGRQQALRVFEVTGEEA